MKKRKGAILVFGIFFMLIVFAIMGYVYEMGRMTIAKMRAQNAADAAAMGAQTVLSNLRNYATTHYMVADFFRRIAVTSSQLENYTFYGLILRSWQIEDVFVGKLAKDNRASDLVKFYHFMFHIQDFAVSRFLAAYDSKIFFRDFIKEEARNHFPKTRKMMQIVSFMLGEMNLAGENQVEGNERGLAIVRFGKYPDWAGGLKVDYEAEVDRPGPSLSTLAFEKEINKRLGRAYAQAYVEVPPSNFLMRTFFTRNWGNIVSIRENFAGLEEFVPVVRADAAAGPKEIEVRLGVPSSIGNIPGIGTLYESGYWAFPQLIPTIKVPEEPVEDQWPYH